MVTASPGDNAPKPNWQLARALYLQGVKNSVIADQCNVSQVALRARVSREKWTSDRDKLKHALQHANSNANGIILPSVTEMGKTVRQLAAAGLVKASQGLDQVKPPRSLKGRRELAETVKAITDPGKTVFAWEDQKPTVVIDLGQLKSARLPGDVEIDAQVIAPEANPPNLLEAGKDCLPAQGSPPSSDKPLQ
jgi:hypothetical protein